MNALRFSLKPGMHQCKKTAKSRTSSLLIAALTAMLFCLSCAGCEAAFSQTTSAGDSQPRAEFKKAVADATKLADEKKFVEALETLQAYLQKYPETKSKPEIDATIAEIQAQEAQHKQRVLEEQAYAVCKDYIAKADTFIKGKEFSRALDFLKSFPPTYAGTRAHKDIVTKLSEVEKKRQTFLGEAKDEFEKLGTEVRSLVAGKEFDKAGRVFDKYCRRFADTEWALKALSLRAKIIREQVAEETGPPEPEGKPTTSPDKGSKERDPFAPGASLLQEARHVTKGWPKSGGAFARQQKFPQIRLAGVMTVGSESMAVIEAGKFGTFTVKPNDKVTLGEGIFIIIKTISSSKVTVITSDGKEMDLMVR